MSQKKELSLLKGNQKFLFRYDPGNEEEVLDSFIELAHDRRQDFDWFDAAVLSFQLSKHLVQEADQLLGMNNRSAANSSADSPPPWP
jgi:hypothetical protein